MKRSLFIRFYALEGLYSSIYATFTVFVISYFQEVRQLSVGTVGLLLCGFTAFSFLGQFAFGLLSDRLGKKKAVFMLLNAVAAFCFYGVYNAQSLGLMTASYFLMGFFHSSPPAILDTWVLNALGDRSELFGSIRSAVPLFYSALMLPYGQLLAKAGYALMLPCALGLSCVLLAVAALTPEYAGGRTAAVQQAPARIPPAFYGFLFVLLLCGIGGSSHQFTPMLNSELDGTVGTLSYALFTASVSQIPWLLFSGKAARISPMLRLIAGGALNILTFVLYCLARSTTVLVVAGVAFGSGFGIILPALRQFVYQSVSSKLQATANSLSDAVYNSLSCILSSGVIGMLGNRIGLVPIMLFFILVQAAGIAMLTLFSRRQSLSSSQQAHALIGGSDF